MKKWMIGLGGLLALQLGLAVTLNRAGDDYSAFKPASKLASFEAALVDSIRIEAANDQSVQLVKNADQWQLPGLDGFPADQQKVTQLLDSLAALKKGWPVATSASAAPRFKVAEEAFERRITLSRDDDEVAQLYLGTSPGLRKVHARAAGQNEVISVAFSLFEANANDDDWIDKAVLKLNEADISQIELPEFSLQQQGETWQLVDLNASEQMIESEAKTFIGKLAGLTVDAVFAASDKPELEKDAPTLKVVVTRKTGDVLSYTFSKLKEGGYLLQRSDRQARFKVANWQIDPIKELKREKLVEAKSAEPAALENEVETVQLNSEGEKDEH